MPSLRELLAQAENAPSSNLANLEKRVAMQQAALDTALDDLAAARAREGLPVDPPELPGPQPGSPRLSPSQVQATVEFVLRADRRRRAEEFIPATPAEPFPAPPSTPQARAEIAQFIINADRKARNER